jgi:hypothetical protein
MPIHRTEAHPAPWLHRAESLPRQIERHLGTPRGNTNRDYQFRGNDISPWKRHLLESGVKVFEDVQSEKAAHSLPSGKPLLKPPRKLLAHRIEERDTQDEKACNNRQLCSRCYGINIESLSSKGGYVHSTILNLSKSAQSCKLCDILLSSGFTKTSCWKSDRYYAVLSLRPYSDEATGLELHVPWNPEQAQFYIETVDVEPWNEPMDDQYYNGELAITPLYRSRENATRLTLRGRALVCFTCQFDPATEVGVYWMRKVGLNTASERSFDIARTWLKQCLASEDEFKPVCRSTPPSEIDNKRDHPLTILPEPYPMEVPARLIDTQPLFPSDGVIQLVETKQLERPYQYATLSYCWGDLTSSNWLTKISNLDQQFDMIQWNTLPATLRDAVLITKKLGIRYVWIDALCIIQDSPLDWSIEAAKMGGIYRGSMVTIVASRSASTSEGCFNEHSTSHLEKIDRLVCVESTLTDGWKSLLYVKPGRSLYEYDHHHFNFYNTEVLHGPLSRRAWAYQEQVLSRRLLFYAKSQLLWQCKHCILCEDHFPLGKVQRPYPILDSVQPISPDSMIQMWYKGAVPDYSRRLLTNGRDKLVAISALAKATYLNRHVEYAAGLWKDCFVPGLLWQRNGLGSKSNRNNCPSWSWASQDSEVSYGLVGSQPLLHSGPNKPKIIEISITQDPENPFGDARASFVKLDTLVMVGWVLRDHFSRYNFNSGSSYKPALIISENGSGRLWQAEAIMDSQDAIGKQFKVLVALIDGDSWRRIMLILEPPDLDANEYRRIGIATIKAVNFDTSKIKYLGKEWPRRIIKLI